jgi:hypothetical protein
MVDESTFVAKHGSKSRVICHVQELGGAPEYGTAFEFFLPRSHAVFVICYNVLCLQHSRLNEWVALVAKHRDATSSGLIVVGTYMADNPRTNEGFLEKHSELVRAQLAEVAPIDGLLLVPLRNRSVPSVQRVKDLVGKVFFTKVPRSSMPVHPALDRVVAQVTNLRLQ